MKKIINFLSVSILISIFALGFVFVDAGTRDEDTIEDRLAQVDRLEMLFEMYPAQLSRSTPFGFEVTPFGFESNHMNIPNVTGMSIPDTENDRIFIGLDVPVTQEAIDFILAFTGIPEELADFYQILGFSNEIGPEIDYNLHNDSYVNLNNYDYEYIYDYSSSQGISKWYKG